MLSEDKYDYSYNYNRKFTELLCDWLRIQIEKLDSQQGQVNFSSHKGHMVHPHILMCSGYWRLFLRE
jgi:hypothetical protein